MALPEENRWAETEEGRERLANLQKTMDGWKAGGYDVSELDEYLKSPDITPEGIDSRLEVVIKRINRAENEAEAKHRAFRNSVEEILESSAPDSKQLEHVMKEFVENAKSHQKEKPAHPETCRCPVCGKTVKPGWKSCPFCRSKLPPSEPQSKSPEPGRWADTEDAKRIIGDIRRPLARWKAAGHDVHELEDYLDSDDPNPTQLFVRLRILLKKIDEPWPGEVERLAPLKCPKCARPVESKHGRCPFCGAMLSLDKPPGPKPRQKAEAPAGRCPQCKGRLGQNDRKCPVCGHRLKSWFSF